jgi:hypothetical protein
LFTGLHSQFLPSAASQLSDKQLPFRYQVSTYPATPNPILSPDGAPSWRKQGVAANVGFRVRKFGPGMALIRRIAAAAAHFLEI